MKGSIYINIHCSDDGVCTGWAVCVVKVGHKDQALLVFGTGSRAAVLDDGPVDINTLIDTIFQTMFNVQYVILTCLCTGSIYVF